MQCPRVWSAPTGDTGSKELWEIAPHKVQIKQYGGRQAAEEKLNLLCMIASKVSSRITTCCPLRHLLRPLVQKKVLCPLTRFLLLGIRKAARVWFTLVYINIYIYIIYIFFIIFIYIYVSAMKWNFPGYASLLSAKDEKIMGSYRPERDGQWWHMVRMRMR